MAEANLTHWILIQIPLSPQKSPEFPAVGEEYG